MSTSHGESTGQRKGSEKKGFPLSPKQIVGIVVLLLVAIFAAQNTAETEIAFFGGSFDSPLWVVLFVVLLLGVAIGFVLPFGRKKD